MSEVGGPGGLPSAEAWAPFRHLYVHIPFCRHKCGYCDFNAYAGMDRLMPDYVDAVLAELDAASVRHRFEALDTVYFGGGTPSLLPPLEIGRLLAGIADRFEIAGGAEVTLEANPASTDAAKLEAWRGGGVNRLSLGVQGFDPAALAVLERRTDGAQATRAFAQARSAGFGNITIDLIYAVPRQTPASWLDTVERAVALGPDHISCYCLTFEEGTLLHRRLRQGRLAEVEADRQWELLDAADTRLSAAGYDRYEVSSWARPGFRSRHNQAYWSCRPVYGAGAGAHSYGTDGSRAWRWWNAARPQRYIELAADPLAGWEELDPAKRQAERLMLGLRTAAGIEPPPGFEGPLEELAGQGLVERRGTLVVPTRRGLDLHNQVALAVL